MLIEHFFPLRMTTLIDKNYSGAIKRDNLEKVSGNNQSRSKTYPGTQETYITQVSGGKTEKGQRINIRSSVEERAALWALYANWKNSFWTQKFGCTPGPLLRLAGFLLEKNRKRVRIVSRVILILKSFPLAPGSVKIQNWRRHRTNTAFKAEKTWTNFKKSLEQIEISICWSGSRVGNF